MTDQIRSGEHGDEFADLPLQEQVLVDDTAGVEVVVAGYVPGVHILNGTDLYVNEGELVGIIGPNGAGKSTLVKAVFGLVNLRSGRVSLRGDDITGLPTHELVK